MTIGKADISGQFMAEKNECVNRLNVIELSPDVNKMGSAIDRINS